MSPFPQDNANKYMYVLWECQNESGVCDGLQPVAWTVLILWGTLEYVQFISKEVLASPNWILFQQYLHCHKIFSKNLRKVDVWKQCKEVKETPHESRRTRRCLPPEKKKQAVRPKLVGSVQQFHFPLPTWQKCLSGLFARLRFLCQVHELLQTLKFKTSSSWR